MNPYDAGAGRDGARELTLGASAVSARRNLEELQFRLRTDSRPFAAQRISISGIDFRPAARAPFILLFPLHSGTHAAMTREKLFDTEIAIGRMDFRNGRPH